MHAAKFLSILYSCYLYCRGGPGLYAGSPLVMEFSSNEINTPVIFEF